MDKHRYILGHLQVQWWPYLVKIIFHYDDSWWRHQMETFSALLALCAGNSPVTGEFPTQRPVTRSFDVFFDLRVNKRLSKQLWGWWFETPASPLWRHCNVDTDDGLELWNICVRGESEMEFIHIGYIRVMSHDVIITSLFGKNDVATSFWRNNDVIITSCVRWD